MSREHGRTPVVEVTNEAKKRSDEAKQNWIGLPDRYAVWWDGRVAERLPISSSKNAPKTMEAEEKFEADFRDFLNSRNENFRQIFKNLVDEKEIWAPEEFQKKMELLKNTYSLQLTDEEAVTALESGEETRDINYAEAKKLGLEVNLIQGSNAAGRLIQEVVDRIININTQEGKRIFISEWKKECPGLPIPCVPPNGFWYLTELVQNKIVSNLEGPQQPVFPHFEEDELLLMNNWEEHDYNTVGAAASLRSKLVMAIFGKTRVTNISRDMVDRVLWEGDPANRQPSERHQQILKQLGCNPKKFEIRLIRQDEYARLAPAKNFGKQVLWTCFDHYSIGYREERKNLAGGHRDDDGTLGVSENWRGHNGDDVAIRLVVSRKQK